MIGISIDSTKAWYPHINVTMPINHAAQTGICTNMKYQIVILLKYFIKTCSDLFKISIHVSRPKKPLQKNLSTLKLHMAHKKGSTSAVFGQRFAKNLKSSSGYVYFLNSQYITTLSMMPIIFKLQQINQQLTTHPRRMP